MPKSDYLKAVILNHVLRATVYTSPATVYAALFTVAPTDAGGGTEVTGGSYTREAITFAAPAGGQVSDSADVLFPIATADWGTIVAFAVFDMPTGGNMLYWAALAAPREILTNDQFRFPSGQLIVSEA